MTAVDMEKCLEETAATSTPSPDDHLPFLMHGYPKLAGRMADRPETAMFRRFNELNIKSLLYMQAELYRLETQLWDAEEEDARRAGDKSDCSRNYDKLLALYKDGDTAQLELVERIQEKLDKYSTCRALEVPSTANEFLDKALIQVCTMLQYKAPDRFDLNDLQCWMDDKIPGEFYILGADRYTWGTKSLPNTCIRDLIGLKPRIKEDAFSRWVAEKGVKVLKYDIRRWFTCQCCFRPKKDCSKRMYYDTDVLKWTFMTTGVFVSLLPVASIAVLLHFKRHGEWVQVGIIAGFNVLIAMFLTVLADAKRADCFAVTAA